VLSLLPLIGSTLLLSCWALVITEDLLLLPFLPSFALYFPTKKDPTINRLLYRTLSRTLKENGHLSYILPRLAHTHVRTKSHRHRRRVGRCGDTSQDGADNSSRRPASHPRARGTRGRCRAAASGIGAAALARQSSTAGGAAARERGIEEEAAVGER
jgi:hypothetical protein